MSKRKEHGGEQPENRKKQRLTDARTIAVQSIPEAGPSTIGNGVKRLGGAIDVEKFVEARKFEISAMQAAQKSARLVYGAATQRVWQTLPRHLRRRAASHDVRRVPLRLRDRAKQEMTAVKKKALSRFRPKQGKAKRLSRTETFVKRQRDKSWLETHIWHAKRMRMQNLWGYRLAITPTEKAFRPSHRASVHGSILHDASYQSTIQLQGPEEIVRSVLDSCCDPQGPGPGAKRYLPGARTVETHMYEHGLYPFGLIGPVTVLWRPLPSNSTAPAQSAAQAQKDRKGKGKAKDTASNSTDSDAVQRTVWIRCHPAISEHVFSVLQTAASSILDAARKAAPQGTQVDEIGIELEDVSGQINAFEIMGPKSNQVLKGALSPVSHDSREEFNKFWASMTDLQTSGAIPRGMAIGFKAIDPRLKFPPKNAKPHPVSASTRIIPSATLAESELWEESIRQTLRKPRYKKKDLDERRSKNLVPGTPLAPLRQDARVPLLLIQRSVERGTTANDLALHGWTVLFPAGWAMPFFSSLTFTGTRVAGQRERQTQAFEAGTAYFPRDYPPCPSYDAYITEQATEEQARWTRTPPAKRVNYEKLGTRSPWTPDWGVVLGIEKPPVTTADPTLVPTQREVEDTTAQGQPWLLRGSDVHSLVGRLMAADANTRPQLLLNEVNALRGKRTFAPLKVEPEAILKGALVRVIITPCTRGSPQDLALIYIIDDAEAQGWKHGSRVVEDDAPDQEFADAKPPVTSIIGYVTTGNFSLSHGTGFALGAISLQHFLAVGEQARRLAFNKAMVKVRDRDGHKCRAAYVELLEV
ncbi:ribonucleases P/MRP protein subunit POP1 [Favolaschia claudopus]|uniref:Ribonucleases P/MRP protein subunit POP1 n=1 Tax=Favolaschia claudopus TaxID=2862362 RepID=A0AAW0D9N9_9AGAR